MKALERLQAHYKSISKQSLDVSALMGEDLSDGEEPLVFYWSALTPATRVEIDSRSPEDEHPHAFAARVVVAMAHDEAGGRLFKPGDEVHVRNTCSAHVLQVVASRMMASPMKADAKKS